jgi:hypothetical protein
MIIILIIYFQSSILDLVVTVSNSVTVLKVGNKLQ